MSKSIVVTGSGAGVGLATVKRCLADGAEVFGLDLKQDPIDQANFHSHPLDVSNSEQWAAFAADIPAESLDHIHLNAGIQSAPPNAPLENYRFSNLSLTRYRQMMGVNVDGVVLGLHYLLPKLKSGGSVVVTCSLAGIVPYDVDPLYSMSKHAVTGIVRSLRKELSERDIRINALCPGGIDTDLIPHEQRNAAAISDFMTPDDIAVEILRLFDVSESGATWAKVAAAKPAWIIAPPGQKKRA